MDSEPEKSVSTCRRAVGVIVAIIGLVGIVGAIVAPILVEKKATEKINSTEFITGPDSDGYALFQDTSKIGMLLKVYVQEFTNPAEFLNGTKPNLKEHGPYTYKVTKLRKNIRWGDDIVKGGLDLPTDDVMQYDEDQEYTFSPDDSCDTCKSDTDIYSIINFPLWAAVTQCQQGSDIACQLIVNAAISNKYTGPYALSRNVSVHDLIYGQLWDLGLLKLKVPGAQPPLNTVDNRIYVGAKNASRAHQFQAYGYDKLWQNVALDGGFPKNGTDQNGMTHIRVRLPGQPIFMGPYKGNFTYLNRSNPWATEAVSKVVGTDGTGFKQKLTSADDVQVFVSQMMRTYTMKYAEDSKLQDLKALRYRISSEDFEVNPDYPISPHGVLDFTNAKGLSLAATKPHFLDTDPSVAATVTGVAPGNIADHGTFLDVQPRTGQTVNAAKRIQVNLVAQPLQLNISGTVKTFLQGAPNVSYIPLVWAGISATATGDLYDKLMEVQQAESLKTTIAIAGYVGGGVLFCIGVALIVIRTENKKRTSLNSQGGYSGF